MQLASVHLSPTLKLQFGEERTTISNKTKTESTATSNVNIENSIFVNSPLTVETNASVGDTSSMTPQNKSHKKYYQ